MTKYMRPNVKDGTGMCQLILRKPIIPTAIGGYMTIALNGFLILYFDNFYQPAGLVFLLSNS
jgi:hypothetical protein